MMGLMFRLLFLSLFFPYWILGGSGFVTLIIFLLVIMNLLYFSIGILPCLACCCTLFI